MSRVRAMFYTLAACSAIGVVLTLVLAGSLSGDPADAARIMFLVPIAGMTSLTGIWAGTLAILEPPALTGTDRRIGRGVLVALTATGPTTLLLVGRFA